MVAETLSFMKPNRSSVEGGRIKALSCSAPFGSTGIESDEARVSYGCNSE